MRRTIFLLFFCLFLFPVVAYANDTEDNFYQNRINFSIGKGIPTPSGKKTSGEMLEFSYQRHPFVEDYKPFFFGADLGGWTTKNLDSGEKSFLLAGVVGLRYDWSWVYLQGQAGIAYISATNENISTHYQFPIRTEIGFKTGKYSVGFFWQHYSNGDTKKPNKGMNWAGAAFSLYSW